MPKVDPLLKCLRLMFDSYLLVLFSSNQRFRSSSGISTSLCSRAPLNGMHTAPGSFWSTHSLIFGSLQQKSLIRRKIRKEIESKIRHRKFWSKNWMENCQKIGQKIRRIIFGNFEREFKNRSKRNFEHSKIGKQIERIRWCRSVITVRRSTRQLAIRKPSQCCQFTAPLKWPRFAIFWFAWQRLCL